MHKAVFVGVFLAVIIVALYTVGTTLLLWYTSGALLKFIAANVFCYIGISLLNKEIIRRNILEDKSSGPPPPAASA